MFREDIHRGEIAEEIILEYFTKHPLYKIIDVRDNKGFQQDDIDFILISLITKQIIYIEVKSDFLTHRTKNIVYEKISSRHANTKGCFEKTKSHYILYYIDYFQTFLVLDTKMLQYYVQTQPVQALKEVCMGDNAKGFLLPMNSVIHQNFFKGFFRKNQNYIPAILCDGGIFFASKNILFLNKFYTYMIGSILERAGYIYLL